MFEQDLDTFHDLIIDLQRGFSPNSDNAFTNDTGDNLNTDGYRRSNSNKYAGVKEGEND